MPVRFILSAIAICAGASRHGWSGWPWKSISGGISLFANVGLGYVAGPKLAVRASGGAQPRHRSLHPPETMTTPTNSFLETMAWTGFEATDD